MLNVYCEVLDGNPAVMSRGLKQPWAGKICWTWQPPDHHYKLTFEEV